MKRSPRLTQGFTRILNPKLERFIRVNPTAVELIRKKPSLGPQNGKWLKRASFISSHAQREQSPNLGKGAAKTPPVTSVSSMTWVNPIFVSRQSEYRALWLAVAFAAAPLPLRWKQ